MFSIDNSVKCNPIKALQEINIAIRMMSEIVDEELLRSSEKYAGAQSNLNHMRAWQHEVIKHVVQNTIVQLYKCQLENNLFNKADQPQCLI